MLPEPPHPPGAHVTDDGTHFTLWSAHATEIEVCIYPADREVEQQRAVLHARQGGWHHRFIPGVRAEMRYGYRANGRTAPSEGLCYDRSKLLLDPYAIEIDRAFRYDPRLADPGADTAAMMPKAIITVLPEPPPHQPPILRPDGVIYELNVRSFTRLHPDVPGDLRGTVAALGHEAVIAHLKKIGVSVVELMPIVAWIDERHLQPFGLVNAWGYNPVNFMALDPRLAPGGVAELRQTVQKLHAAGIGVVLDLVYNHTGEGDAAGPSLCLRGIDGASYFRSHDGRLVNDTGCGNTVRCDHPAARRLILDSMRHFVNHAGIDGFRFDLAPVLGREGYEFNPRAELFREMLSDPVLRDRLLIAEPWDVGANGYQLGNFPAPMLEWNDRYRDTVRRFWRGDPMMLQDLATRLAGSDDIYSRPGALHNRTVNYVACHDGFTLADITTYERKHNEANGENNRDGQHENYSWNHGIEGRSTDPDITSARIADVKAMLSTLFASRGAIMLTAGDEFGRTQRGNNNAYAQDNETSWLDWMHRNRELEMHVAELAAIRARHEELFDNSFLRNGQARWLRPDGHELNEGDWRDPFMSEVAYVLPGIAVLFNRSNAAVQFTRPPMLVPARSVRFYEGDVH